MSAGVLYLTSRSVMSWVAFIQTVLLALGVFCGLVVTILVLARISDGTAGDRPAR